MNRGLQASRLTFLLNWKEPGDPQPRRPPGLGPAQVGVPQARAGVGRSCPGALPTGGRAGQELQPLGGGGLSPHAVGESHVPQASPQGSSQRCRATLCTARSAGPRVAPPCGAHGRPRPATGPRAFWWGGKWAPSPCGAKAQGGVVLWAGGPGELWGLGLVALAGTGVLGVSEKPSWFFSLPRASCPPPGGNSGLAQEWGRHVYFWGIGRDESRRAGFWTRGFSKAALLDVCRAARFTRAAFHCSHLPETRLTPGAHLHPLPCGLP